ncbi:MAG: tetratricopeptide repeat protein [Sideroxydans sp.]|nr:tetratricopeptide repeat protein [Sideroxydans sp.]
MSLINQMLNDLERRGSDAGADVVRAVPRSAGLQRLLVRVTAVALVMVLAGALWKALYQLPVPSKALVQQAVTLPRTIPQPVSQPHPVAVLAAAAPEAVLPEAEYAAPASRLSFELSSIPLPVSAPSINREQQMPVERHVRQPQPAEKPGKLPAAATTQDEYGGKVVKHISPEQQAEDEFGQALALIQQGRKSEALPHLETTLQLNPGQAVARQTLVGLLLESKRNAEAERILQDGLRHDPKQSSLAMLLARLQVERGAMPQALATLEKTLPFADQQADYHAFVAAVLQRLNRHKEAITHYQIALHLSPKSAIWWMGLGISLQAVDFDEDARDAFQHAADLHQLKPELQAFVEKQLKALAPSPAK